MPKVPSYDSLQTNAPQLPDARLSAGVISPDAMATAGNQAKQLGQAELTAADSAAQIQSGMQYKADLVRVTAAMNQVHQTKLDLTYGTKDNPSTGYVAQKGQYALDPDTDGKSLPQRYSEQLQQKIDEVAATLGTEHQKQMFTSQATALATRFNGELQAHQAQEFQRMGLSTYGAAAELAGQQAELNWDKPDLINNTTKDAAGNDQPSYVDQVKANIARYGEIAGLSATEVTLKQQKAESQIHTKVIEAALQNNNPTYANMYMQKYKDHMTPDDILKANGVVNRTLDSHISQAAVAATTQQLTNKFTPPDIDRLANIVTGIESGGKDFNPDGTPVTSAKGAKYAMQVMPATAANPGFGIQPAKDNSPAEYNRVGNEYLGAMVKKYGNPAMVMAAYNAGPGATDEAMAKAKAAGAPQSWLSYLPQETQTYVQKGMSKLNSGGGAPALPTELEFVNDAVGRLGPDPRPEQVALTTAAATRQYGMIIKSRNEQGDQALRNAQQALVQNGGNFDALDPNIKSDLVRYDPGKYDDAMKFAKAISKGPNETNPALYMQLVNHPEEAAAMSDAQFMQLRTQLSEGDFKHFTKERADFLNGKVDESYGAINTKALSVALNNRLTSLGVNPTPAPKDTEARAQVGTIQKYVRDSIFVAQAQTGKKMTPVEIEAYVDNLFAKDATFNKTLLGFNIGTTTQNLMTMKVDDIPADSLNQLKAAFSRQGVAAPTNDQLMRAYWNIKNARK